MSIWYIQLRAINRSRIASQLGSVAAEERIAIRDELQKLLGQNF